MHESDWIKSYIAPLVDAPGAHGLRDDVAMLSANGPTIATIDTLVEHVHFLPDDPLDTVGQKLIRVNVSDTHAKGALPAEALLSVAWPRDKSEPLFASLMAGIGRDLKAFGISLIGGDLVGTDGPLTLTLTLTGSCLAENPIRRTGGQAGQALLVEGEIGWGGLGLSAAKSQGDPQIVERYRVPRVSDGEIAKTVAKIASASMDVSDGLLIDAARLADASGCGVKLDLESVPLAQPTAQVDDIIAQCTSGDDYRVLIATDPEISISGFTKIGELTESIGLKLAYNASDVNLPSTLGFEH
jgi:thiamine-monophosphate kinase